MERHLRLRSKLSELVDVEVGVDDVPAGFGRETGVLIHALGDGCQVVRHIQLAALSADIGRRLRRNRGHLEREQMPRAEVVVEIKPPVERFARRRVVTLAAEGVLGAIARSEEHTSELQSHVNLVCRLLLEKKKKKKKK